MAGIAAAPRAKMAVAKAGGWEVAPVAQVARAQGAEMAAALVEG